MENEISWLDYMKTFRPDITEEEAEYILWNETCYPFSDEITIKQLNAFFKTQQSK